MWETTYLHVLTGEDAVVEWASGSSLRPFLDKLPPDLRQAYRAAYAEALRPHYPQRSDGTTLLPFRRLFILAQR
jgi:trans-aconitate 2-methyltransferase